MRKVVADNFCRVLYRLNHISKTIAAKYHNVKSASYLNTYFDSVEIIHNVSLK